MFCLLARGNECLGDSTAGREKEAKVVNGGRSREVMLSGTNDNGQSGESGWVKSRRDQRAVELFGLLSVCLKMIVRLTGLKIRAGCVTGQGFHGLAGCGAGRAGEAGQ